MGERLPFYVTFGVQYATEPHPTFPDAHPDGWVTVWAESYGEAHDMARERFGTSWAFLYHRERFGWEHHPRGELAVLGDPPDGPLCRLCGRGPVACYGGELVHDPDIGADVHVACLDGACRGTVVEDDPARKRLREDREKLIRAARGC